MKIKHCLLSILLVLVFTVSANAYFKVELGPAYFPQRIIGRPIANAQIYVGIPDTDPEIIGNQKTLYVQQEDGTIVAVAQPIRTSMGGVTMYSGSPVVLLVDSNYSLKVLNSIGVQIYYTPSVDAWDSGTSIFNYCTPNYLAVDQGAIGALITVKSCVDSIGADSGTIYLRHNSPCICGITTYTFSTSEVIPSNINIIIEKGAILSDGGGTANLTINKLQNPGLNKIFNWNGTGKVSFGDGAIEEIYPEWWGVDGTADEVEINKAINAIEKGVVRLQNYTYTTENSIVLENYISLIGGGWGSVLSASISSDGFPFILVSEKHDVILRDFLCDGNVEARTLTCGNGCIYLQSGAYDNLVENIKIVEFGTNTGNGNFITLEVEETDASDTYNNIIRNCILIDTAGKSGFGIRVYTEWTEPIASDAYTRFVRDNTIENCKLDGFVWNTIEIVGPASVHNYIHGNIITNCAGLSACETDKGASSNIFIGNQVRNMLPMDSDIHAFRDQGEPADGIIPERFAQDNLFDGNSVNGIEQTGVNATTGFYASRSKRCIVSNHVVTNIVGVNMRSSAFYLGKVEDIMISNAQVNEVETGIFFANDDTQIGVNINDGNFNINGGFFNSGGSLGTRERIIINGVNIKSVDTTFELKIAEIIVSNNFITGSNANTGIYAHSAVAGIFVNNIIDSFTTGISIQGDDQLAIGNVFLSCTGNLSTGADLRSTVHLNLGDGTANRAPIITNDWGAPVVGTFLVGDIVFATVPVAGGTMGWVCVTGGTPGTWKTFGAITP